MCIRDRVTAITHTPYGDDARTAPQLFPQPSDMNVDGARVVAPRALVPHGPEQLVPGHGPVRRAEQVLQQRELLEREGDGPAVDGDLARRRVDDDLVSRRGETRPGDQERARLRGGELFAHAGDELSVRPVSTEGEGGMRRGARCELGHDVGHCAGQVHQQSSACELCWWTWPAQWPT